MADWNDPRTTGVSPAATVGVPRAARDVGLRSHMLSVYNYMASGVLLTGIVALLFAKSGAVDVAGQLGRRGRPSGARLSGRSSRRSASSSWMSFGINRHRARRRRRSCSGPMRPWSASRCRRSSSSTPGLDRA